MKNRIAYSFAGALLAVTSSAMAATFVPDVTGLTNGQILNPTGTGPGAAGWSQSESNPGPTAPIAYGQAITGNPVGAAIGGNYGTPSAAAGYMSQTIGIGSIGGNSVAMNFTVGRFDISPSPDPQNGFEVGAYTAGGSNLFSFVLVPTVDPDIWTMAYRGGASGNTSIFSGSAFALDQISTLRMDFTAAGATTNFALSVQTGLTTLSTSGNISDVDPGTTLGELRVSILKVPLTDPVANPFDAYGTNFIAVTVPEPTSVMLLGLAAGLGMVRRRRA